MWCCTLLQTLHAVGFANATGLSCSSCAVLADVLPTIRININEVVGKHLFLFAERSRTLMNIHANVSEIQRLIGSLQSGGCGSMHSSTSSRQASRFCDSFTTYWLKIVNFPYPFSFRAFARGDRFPIYRQVLRILKPESSRLPTVIRVTDGRTDGRTDRQRLDFDG